MPRFTSGTSVFGSPMPSFIVCPFVSAANQLDQLGRVVVPAERWNEIQACDARAQLFAQIDGNGKAYRPLVGGFAHALTDRIGDVDTRNLVVQKLGVPARRDPKHPAQAGELDT